MNYSSAVFPRPHSSLEEASRFKVDRICGKLALGPEDHLLEIGTGWGGFALHAAREYGCRVTTATISRPQRDLARRRAREAGLEGRVEVLLADYRDLRGEYDKLVSIEMIEAVGHHYLDTYFGCCARLLKPEGLMLLQAIVIADRAYERARRSVDFIKACVFPGSCIPSVAAIGHSLAAATDMRLLHLEDIGPHYARTLRGLAGAVPARRGAGPAAGLRRRVRPHVGLLLLLLHRRLRGGAHLRRADAPGPSGPPPPGGTGRGR